LIDCTCVLLYQKKEIQKSGECAERDLQFSFIFFFVKREMREMRSFFGGGGPFPEGAACSPLLLFLLSSLSLSREREREAKKIEKEHTA